MTHAFTLANATLVLPDRVMTGSVAVADGEIVEISEGDRVPVGAEDCGGEIVAPGLIELHTDNLERHIQPRPKVDWPHNAAILAHDAELASVGITTVFDAMRVGIIDVGARPGRRYARKLASELLALVAQDALKISHFLHLRAEVCSETLSAEMAEFDAEDRVGIVSLMDHTPGQRQFRDMRKFEDYMKGKYGMSDAELAALVERRKALRQRVGTRQEAYAVDAARRYGAVLASHDDTTEAQVRVSEGHGVAMAEFPTTEEAAEACFQRGIAVIMGAPNLIRGASHSGNVAAGMLAEKGHLDILSSDYVPSALLLGAVKLGQTWGDMARGLATVTANPAKAVGLADRGVLAVGKRADLIRFVLQGETPALRSVWSRGRRVA